MLHRAKAWSVWLGTMLRAKAGEPIQGRCWGEGSIARNGANTGMGKARDA